MRTRYAFAGAFLACFGVTGLVYSLLDPAAQARLVAWASTNVANLEHEPVLPLLVSAFVAPGYLVAWPVLIALALFGANRALGNARTALVCLAGHVIGTLVSEGIVAYRVDAGQLSAANRHLTDVGPSYVVVSAVVVALACGTWLAPRAGRRRPGDPGVPRGHLRRPEPARRGRRRAPDGDAHRGGGHRRHPVPPAPARRRRAAGDQPATWPTAMPIR